MVLYSLTGTIPYSELSGIVAENLSDVLITKLEKLHPHEVKLGDAILDFDKDGIFYRLNVEA